MDYFLYGYIIYTVFFVLGATESSFFSAAACQGVQIIGFLLVTFGAFGLMRFKFDDKYLELIFGVYILYLVTVVVRGIKYDSNSLKRLFLDPASGLFAYFTPLVLLLPINIGTLKRLINTTLILGVFFIIFVAVFYNVLHDPDRINLVSLGLVENFSSFLASGTGFILMIYVYNAQKKEFFGIGKKNVLAAIVMLLALFFALYRARRGLIFICVSMIAAAVFTFILSSKKKMLIIFMGVVLAILCSFFIASIKTPSMLNFLLERGEEDTRTGVEVYMYNDMTTTDWVIGKGINGEYYCPIVENVNNASGYRENIETGYLQMSLKGGILSIALLLMILLPAIYKGFFKSQNVLSKAAAIWIFLWIVYEYPTIGAIFNMHYILVWMSVGICYSANIRNLSDTAIKTHLQRFK